MIKDLIMRFDEEETPAEEPETPEETPADEVLDAI